MADKIIKILKNQKFHIFLCLTVLIFITGLLRHNIGSYEYIKDEASTLLYMQKGKNSFSTDFILRTKRPPLQYQVAQAVHTFGFDYDNELVMRSAYTLAGFSAVIVLFFFILHLVKNPFVALLGASLYSVNGFVVALSKLVQYQPFVMFFTISATFLFYLYSQKKTLRYLISGILVYSLAIYAHWDAIYFGPIIFIYFLQGFKLNKKHLLPAFLSGIPILIFLVPYFFNLQNTSSDEYILDRVGGVISLGEQIKNYRYTFELYNPFLYLNFFLGASLISVFSLFKRKFEYLWYLLLLGIFFFVINEPGTHVYNLFVPFSICFSLAIAWFLEKSKKLGLIIYPLVVCYIVFFTYQSYLLFVDQTVEYPVKQETYFNGWETKEYTHQNASRYMIGFPNTRFFKDAATQLRVMYPDYEEFTLATNENIRIAELYTDLEAKKSEKMFLFGVKEPSNFVVDSKFKDYRGKEEIVKARNEDGRTMNTVYVWYRSVQEELEKEDGKKK